MTGREPRASIRQTTWWESASNPTAFFFQPLTLELWRAKDLMFHVTTDNEGEPSDGEAHSFLSTLVWPLGAASPS